MHAKIHQDEALQIFKKLFNQIGAGKWRTFISNLKEKANKDDQSQILVSNFVKVYHKFDAKLRPKELIILNKCFPGSMTGANGNDSLDISKLYDQKFSMMQE